MGDIVVLKPYRNHELFKADTGAMRFQVKGRHMQSAFIFTAEDDSNIELYKVVLGVRSKLHDIKGGLKIVVDTPNVLNSDEYQEFWATWYNRVIRIGQGGQAEPFLKYNMPRNNEHRIGYVKFYTRCHGFVSPEWKIEMAPIVLKPTSPKKMNDGQLTWVDMTDNELPLDALIGGFENEPIYIARSYHNGSICPGKYIPSKNLAYVPWGHREHQKHDFQILCGYNAQWVPTHGDNIPENAFIGGTSEVRDEPLYIGRAMHKGNLLIGKVHVLYKTCYLPYKGKEIEVGSYEILVMPDVIPRGVCCRCNTSRWKIGECNCI